MKGDKNFQHIEIELTGEMKKLEALALQEYSKIKGLDSSIHSFHGTIANNKAVSLDMVKGKWMTFDEYLKSWLSGFRDFVASGRFSMMHDMFKVQSIREYVLLFLERDFYRHIKVRMRDKPQENLWSIWFGDKTLYWGLFIAPRLVDGTWENKPGLIRRVPFEYWTIGHILNSGLVDPENDTLYKFSNLDEFLKFYESILKRVSNSSYEKQIFDFYRDYLKSSSDPYSEPFLIPEFRYDGLSLNHKYRLDFTILNCYSGERIGFELSPQSSHMSVSGIRTKSQAEMNKDLMKQWGKEMGKRNDYFQQFGVTTITFADDDLKDMDKCFRAMEFYLQKRKPVELSIDLLIGEIISI